MRENRSFYLFFFIVMDFNPKPYGAYRDGAARQVNVPPHRDSAAAQASIPPSHSILTPGQPVLSLFPIKCQASRQGAAESTNFNISLWFDPAGFEPTTSQLLSGGIHTKISPPP